MSLPHFCNVLFVNEIEISVEFSMSLKVTLGVERIFDASRAKRHSLSDSHSFTGRKFRVEGGEAACTELTTDSNKSNEL